MVREIQLTQGKVALVDDEDYNSLMEFNWFAARQRRRNREVYYAVRSAINTDGRYNKQVFMHRIILGLDEEDLGVKTDHEDGDGLNNQRYNLRRATYGQNNSNRIKTQEASSRYKGVSWDTRAEKWVVQIQHNHHRFRLGFFDDEEEAAKTYDREALKLFGEFARTNFEVR